MAKRLNTVQDVYCVGASMVYQQTAGWRITGLAASLRVGTQHSRVYGPTQRLVDTAPWTRVSF